MYTERNISNLFEYIRQYSDSCFMQTNSFSAIEVENSIWPNQIWALERNGQTRFAMLDELEQENAQGRIPGLVMGNASKPDPELLAEVKRRNYKCGSWTAMSHGLTSLKKLQAIANFEIRIVDNTDDLKLWLKIANTELMGAESLNEGLFHFLMNSEQCWFFLGFEGDVAVATAMFFEQDGLGGIYLVSTKSGFRQRGYGAQLTQACLLEAKNRELSSVEIQATALGKGVYASLGFSDEGEIPVFRINSISS